MFVITILYCLVILLGVKLPYIINRFNECNDIRFQCQLFQSPSRLYKNVAILLVATSVGVATHCSLTPEKQKTIDFAPAIRE